MSIHDAIARDVPEIARGKVWCTQCRRVKLVNGAECLRTGWPVCCGQTMTIDSPQKRVALRKRTERGSTP
jgi:hypothetical protein